MNMSMGQGHFIGDSGDDESDEPEKKEEKEPEPYP